MNKTERIGGVGKKYWKSITDSHTPLAILLLNDGGIFMDYGKVLEISRAILRRVLFIQIR